MSASSTPTVWPACASAAARLTVTDDLPTPPFARGDGQHVARLGDHRLPPRSRARSSGLWSSPRCAPRRSSPPQTIFVRATPGCSSTRVSTSFLISARIGQPLIVSLISTVTQPSSATSTEGTMPSDTMSAPSSGSITFDRTAMTSSTVGGAPTVSFAARVCGVMPGGGPDPGAVAAMERFYRPIPCNLRPWSMLP